MDSCLWHQKSLNGGHALQTIAVLMTCHNRRIKTLGCLEALYSSEPLVDASFVVFLVDDGSKDGTSEAVKGSYPAVHILAGDGNLFWNGGMRVAFAKAMQTQFDFYLWLNDDTFLYPSALPSLLALANSQQDVEGKLVVAVGTTQDATTGVATYGGLRQTSIWRPLSHVMVLSDKVAYCETVNGNCVLIPSAVAERVGNLDKAFTHAMGDIDYGLRVSQAGFPIAVLPSYIGICNHNSKANTFQDSHLSFTVRWRNIMSQKGLPPKQWYVLVRRHAGLLWPFLFFWPYIKIISSIIR